MYGTIYPNLLSSSAMNERLHSVHLFLCFVTHEALMPVATAIYLFVLGVASFSSQWVFIQ